MPWILLSLPGFVVRNLTVMLLAGLLLAGCAAPKAQYKGPGETEPRLEQQHIIAHDGFALRLRRWPVDKPQAVVLALHGYNDYGGAFRVLSEPFSQHHIQLYAYDQRSFGESGPQGFWPGHERLTRDAVTALQLLRQRYPDTPLYLMGMSMGGAVALLAMQHEALPPIDGSVLIAPAVWGRDTMPWYQRFGLWLGNAVAPGMTVSKGMASPLGIHPTPSDDKELLRAQARDPLVQKNSRIATLHGLANLMDKTLSASGQLTGPALILYGDNDQIIPPPPFCHMLGKLPDARTSPWQLALYPGGYHMLTRYSGSSQVIEDILVWLTEGAESTLPSGHGVGRQQALSVLCE